jgi:uncharacterized integral membrane protein
MGEKKEYQPLTTADKVTVVIYRLGIVLSAVTAGIGAYMTFTAPETMSGTIVAGLVLAIHVSVGLSVVFIHLYMGMFRTILRWLYAAALACLVALFYVGASGMPAAFANRPWLALLLVPVAAALGFITAKEAYCFKLYEGYGLAVIMPAALVLAATGVFGAKQVAYGMVVIASGLALFTVRKVFMPLAYDIGDKTAYE